MAAFGAREGGSSQERTALENHAEFDARFERRLDIWLSIYRLGIGIAGFLLVLTLLPTAPGPMLVLIGFYVLAGAAVFPALRYFGSTAKGKRNVRAVILSLDVLTVSALTFGLGARGSPAAFFYVPIVVGWALLPQRILGRLALLLVLVSLGALLSLEPSAIGWFGVSISDELFFIAVTCVLLAVHQLLAYTVARLHEHSRMVSTLLAERRARERDAELAAQLEEAQRLEALGRLAGGVAHDFNNLLTAFIGSAELAGALLRKDPDGAEQELESIKEAAERGAGLTAQLLDFASRRPTEPRDFDLNRAVTSAAQLLHRLLPDAVRLQLELCPEVCGVRLDPGSLERVVLNLGVNAVDAMPEGGILTLAVAATASEGSKTVELEVRDTGLGIPPEDMPFIFDPFFTRKPRGKGTGLGLASVYGIVRQTGGEIEAESTPGAGTTFRIRWPRVPLAAEPVEAAPHEVHRGEASILLVDDDDAVRTILEHHLRGAGYHLVSVGSALEALSVLERGPEPDLLVTDVSMPVMSGLELVREVRERGSRLPVLLISGYAAELDRDGACAQLGAEFLAKPFTGERLVSEVAAILERGPTSGDTRSTSDARAP